MESNEGLSKEIRTCDACKRQLPLRGPTKDGKEGWAPTKLRRFLLHNGGTYWVCYDCQYRKCEQCGVRPKHVDEGGNKSKTTVRSLCDSCRWPVCSGKGCHTPRPQKWHFSVSNMEHWFCSACSPKVEPCVRKCTECNECKAVSYFARQSTRCAACQYPPCAACNHRRSETTERAVLPKSKIRTEVNGVARLVWYLQY